MRGRTEGVPARIMSAIGVMPAIGSFAKAPRRYEMAPTILPSI